MESNKEQPETQKSWYDKWYLVLLTIPVIILILSLIYLGTFYSKHGDFINKDVSLSGGTTITLNLNNIDSDKLESSLKPKFPDITIRKLTGMETGEQLALIVESSASPDELKPAIEEFLNLKLTDENSSVEFTGSTLSSSFYKQLITALIIAFILMSIVIFILFRTFIPSIAVIFAAFSDIIMALAFVNILGLKISAAGIAAFLMLVGYSVDTDILLTTRALKKAEGKLNERISRTLLSLNSPNRIGFPGIIFFCQE